MKIIFYGFRHYHIDSLYKMAIESKDVDVVACVEDDEKARLAATQRLGINFSTKSYEELLNTDIDAVAIGGCYGDRGEAIIKALKAGKHVIADKPICINKEEYNEIIKLVNEKSLKLYIMFDLRYMTSAVTAKKIFDEGKLGKVINVSFIGQHFLDYGNRPMWYFEKGKHGGTLNDLAIHGVDLIRYLTGQGIKEVHAARTFNSYAKEEKDFKDCALFMAGLEGGGEVIADTSYSSSVAVYASDIYWNFKFWCEKGMVTFSWSNPDVTVYYVDKKEPEVFKGEKGSNWLDDFIKDVNSGDMATTIEMLASAGDTLDIQDKANG